MSLAKKKKDELQGWTTGMSVPPTPIIVSLPWSRKPFRISVKDFFAEVGSEGDSVLLEEATGVRWGMDEAIESWGLGWLDEANLAEGLEDVGAWGGMGEAFVLGVLALLDEAELAEGSRDKAASDGDVIGTATGFWARLDETTEAYNAELLCGTVVEEATGVGGEIGEANVAGVAEDMRLEELAKPRKSVTSSTGRGVSCSPSGRQLTWPGATGPNSLLPLPFALRAIFFFFFFDVSFIYCLKWLWKGRLRLLKRCLRLLKAWMKKMFDWVLEKLRKCEINTKTDAHGLGLRGSKSLSR
jgi:hypothetical protein